MFLPTIFFVAFALYVCITITLVFALIYNSRKSKYPDLKAMKQGVDYFTQEASSIFFWLDKNPNKKVINTLPAKSKLFVCSGSGSFSELANVLEVTVYAPSEDLKYLFNMMIFVYTLKTKVKFVDKPELALISCEMKNKGSYANVFSYKDVHINRINFFLPFARFINNDQDEMFLIVDYLLYDVIPRHIESTKRSDLDNFYNLYFPFYATEGFEQNSELFIFIDKPIPDLKMIINKYDDFRVMKIKVQLFPQIQRGDKVSISNQTSPSENGLFYVERKDSDWIYVQTYQYIYNFYNDFILIRKTNNGIVGKRKGNLKRLEKAWFIDLDLPGTITEDDVAVIWKNKGDEDNYHCIPDNSYKTQQSCESQFDMIGNPKPFHIWDKMCMKNTDCPFYKKSNQRGGCDMNGFCEMPIGVTRIGYTRYAKGENSFPYCHQCKRFDSKCCDQQTTPDYAFAFDQSSSFMS